MTETNPPSSIGCIMHPRTAIAATLLTSAPLAEAAEFQAPKSLGDSSKWGTGIQRTMTLLATSTAEHRNAVKILFYGQSITEQDWWKEIAADLRKRFPFADLIIENRAIGGHSSQLLHRTAEADLYPFYPDLVIFHVYGAHNHYEDIIRRIRERTTAEVLIQTDHLGKNDKLDEPTDPASSPAQWNSFMNYNFLPGLGTKYNIGIVNQRNIWKQYLKDYQLAPEALLKDDVHLNENGCQLMAAIVNQWLFYQPRTSRTDWENLVRNLPAPAMADGKITFEFEGNRIDAINSTTTAEVLIDGQPVSAQRGVYAFTRTSGYNGTNWPCLLKVDRGPTAPQEEDWTVTLQEANDDYISFNFTLTGSKTGPDGSGKAGQKFVSNTGRIAIQPEDWNLNFSRKVFKKPLPADFKIQWKSRLLGTDHLTAGDRVILAQGLTNGKHTLTLSGMHSGEGVGGFTVYRPPLVAKNP